MCENLNHCPQCEKSIYLSSTPPVVMFRNIKYGRRIQYGNISEEVMRSKLNVLNKGLFTNYVDKKRLVGSPKMLTFCQCL